MNKSIVLAFLLALAITACDKCKSGKAKMVIPASETFVDPSEAVAKPPADKGDCQVMTNEAIIAAIKLCTDNNMNANHFHCGDDARTTNIECRQKDVQ